jgi:Uncharacterized protein conserved in bacteria (DUF2059)
MKLMGLLASAALIVATPAWAQAPAAAPQAANADRMALATKVADQIMPKGTYSGILDSYLPELSTFVLDKKAVDFVKLAEPYAKTDRNKKDYNEALKFAGNKTVFELLNENAPDPHWRERIKIMMKVFSDEYRPMFDVMEPAVRAGIAKTYARKFSAEQLTEMNNFLSTPTGKAFSGIQLMQYYEAEVLMSYFEAVPKMIPLVEKYGQPQYGKQLEDKMRAAMAHLPPMKSGPFAPRPKGVTNSTVPAPSAEEAVEAAAAAAMGDMNPWEDPANWSAEEKAAYDAATAKADAASEELAKIYETATANAKAKHKAKK